MIRIRARSVCGGKSPATTDWKAVEQDQEDRGEVSQVKKGIARGAEAE